MMEAHTSMLALAAALSTTITALSSTVVWLIIWRQAGTRYMLLLLGGWLLICLHASLLAVTAGPNPVFRRADIATWIYGIEITAALVMEIGKLLMLRQMWRNGKAQHGAGDST